MNSSDLEFLRPQIYNYLGFRGVSADPKTDALIGECIAELEKIAQFRYLYRLFDEPPKFLAKEPYKAYLDGSRGVIICAMTLGISVDREINRLFRVNAARAVVLDSCASAYLEFRADEYEKTLGDDLAPRFCPGYGGSPLCDLREIFGILSPEKIGMSLNESDFMLPSKSMAGIIAVGKAAEKSCAGCFMAKTCNYLKEGRRCYSQTGK